MAMNEQGENLIFLISAPRSGSTLLQHILGGHSLVHTLPEPWIMLHPVFALRGSELTAPYNSTYAHLALNEFLQAMPEGATVYEDGIRKLACGLYSQALVGTGKKYFLDKTTRYYLIIRELRKIFPVAKFVFLLRNPMAIFTSILDTNFKGDFRGLFQDDRKADILLAPRLLCEGMDTLGNDAVVVRYEKLVTEPESQIRRMCDYLRIPFEREILQYGEKVRFTNTRFVDPKSIYVHSRPTGEYINSWQKQLDSVQKVKLAGQYLDNLGRDAVECLGYSFDELKSIIKRKRRFSLLPTSSWRLLYKDTKQLTHLERFWLAFTNGLQLLYEALRRYGLVGTAKRVIKLLSRGAERP